MVSTFGRSNILIPEVFGSGCQPRTLEPEFDVTYGKFGSVGENWWLSHLQVSDLVVERREARHKSFNSDSGPTRLEKHQTSAGIARIQVV